MRRTVTHLVVEPHGRHDRAHLVPIDAVASCDDGLVLSWTANQIEQASQVQETDYLEYGEWPQLEDGWEMGVSRILALPYYPEMDGAGFEMGMESEFVMDSMAPVTETFDRIPLGTAEIRRASEVRSSDDHLVGHVDGFVVGADGELSHVVLERGHLWGHREVTIPIGEVEVVESDRVHLRVPKDEVGSFPSVRFHRHHRRR